jgi:hypothetical protein
MFFTGGTIEENKVFSKILSIGFEFETRMMSKLSLHGDTLINSDTTPMVIQNMVENKTYKKLIETHSDDNNNHYVKLMILKQNIVQTEENDVNDYEIFNEYIYDINLQNNEVDFMVTNDIGNNVIQTLTQKYVDSHYVDENDNDTKQFGKNEMFVFKSIEEGEEKDYKIQFTDNFVDDQAFSNVEYIITYYKPQINKNVIVNIFENACQKIIEHLSKLKQKKGVLLILLNDELQTLYKKKNNDKEHNEKHKKSIEKEDDEFFYKMHQHIFKNKIISESYNKPKLFTIDDKVYVLVKRYSIFEKEGTNLYYLNSSRDNNLNNVYFTPQMTFKCECQYTIDIIQKIKENAFTHDEEHNEIFEQILELANDTTDNFFNQTDDDNHNNIFTEYNKKSQISMVDLNIHTKEIKCCFFFIFYKIYAFFKLVIELIKNPEKLIYVKNYIPYLARHYIIDLYIHIKNILKKYEKFKNINMNLLFDPDILTKLKKISNFENNYITQFEKIANANNKLDENFEAYNNGNPMNDNNNFFKYMDKYINKKHIQNKNNSNSNSNSNSNKEEKEEKEENKLEEEENKLEYDWLVNNDFDVSTCFPLEYDVEGRLLFFVECRNFSKLVNDYYKTKDPTNRLLDNQRQFYLSFMKKLKNKSSSQDISIPSGFFGGKITKKNRNGKNKTKRRIKK